MEVEDEIMDRPEEAASSDSGYGFLVEGIVCWVGFVTFLTGFAPAFSGGFLMIVSLICGAHVLKAAPLRNLGRLHAVAGMTLWLAFFAVLFLLGVLHVFQRS